MSEQVLLQLEGGRVRVEGIGLLCPAGIGREGAEGGRPGEIPGFRPRAYIQDRKSLKLMTRAVQVGVSAVRLATGEAGELLDRFHPDHRGMFVGGSPQPGDPDDLRPALEASFTGTPPAFDLQRFAAEGFPLIHPLWLVRGLSNNVLGFASAIHDLRGVNSNYCDGPEGGWTALREGVFAILEGRARVVIAGGADSLVGFEPLLAGRGCGEGAAFFVLVPDPGDGAADTRVVPLDCATLDPEEELLGYLGAATWPVALARHVLRGG